MNELIVHSSDPVVLVGGAELGPQDINIFQTRNAIFVGVDGGADHLWAAGIVPQAVIGDLDSLSDAARSAFSKLLYKVSEQDTVDFEKALTRVDAPIVYAIGFWGGRVDHSLAVLNVLARHADRVVILVGPSDASRVIADKSVTYALPVGTRLSLMPMGACNVTTTGLEWDLAAAQLAPDAAGSPSNAVAAPRVQVQTDGPLLVTVPLNFMDALI